VRNEDIVDELYDVAVLSVSRRPMAIGLKSDEIRRFIRKDAVKLSQLRGWAGPVCNERFSARKGDDTEQAFCVVCGKGSGRRGFPRTRRLDQEAIRRREHVSRKQIANEQQISAPRRAAPSNTYDVLRLTVTVVGGTNRRWPTGVYAP
jgi:hypothetical protein